MTSEDKNNAARPMPVGERIALIVGLILTLIIIGMCVVPYFYDPHREPRAERWVDDLGPVTPATRGNF